MKIQCPECNKVYNIDDKMIPDAGAKVKCKCETIFFIKKDSVKADEEPIIHDESKAEDKCPKCSHNRCLQDLECPSCGIIYEKYKEKPKIQEEPKPEEEFKAEEVLRLKEALKKAEEALKAADGKQKVEKNPDEIKKTLKYPILAVTISICLMFGTYFLLTSRPIQIAKLESEPIKSEQPKAEPVKTAQSEQVRFVNAFFYAQSNGERARDFFCDRNSILVVDFFAVRSWSVLDSKDGSWGIPVRVESSTKGGFPVINIWKIVLKKRNDQLSNAENYCIEYFMDSNNRIMPES